MTTTLLEQRRQALADQQALLQLIEENIRHQRLDDLQNAEDALVEALDQRARLEETLNRDDQAEHVKALHQRWLDMAAAYDSRDTWQPPQVRVDQYPQPDKPHPSATFSDAELRRIEAQRQAFENRDRQWRQRICEAQRECEAAAAAETTRRSELARNEIHREIERLTRQRDAALAALSSPIE